MTSHFDMFFEDVKTAVETLGWKVGGQANEIWWLTQNHPGSISELVADLESKLQRQTHNTGGSAGTKRVRVRISECTNLEVFAGDRATDKEGFLGCA